ncbi:MAG: hypothetical protein ACKVQS_00820 [Fimbriimonadaceae bacterium]
MLALFSAALMFAFVGCTPTETTAPKEETATASNTASTEKATCADCGHEMDKSAMKEIDGKMVCVNCAEKKDGNHDAEMISCACGKQVAKTDSVDIDGKAYCKDCAAKMGKGDVPTETNAPSTDDHEHKEGDTH